MAAAAVLGLAISVAGSLQAGALAGMAVAFIVVLCMSGNYVVVRHRRDVGMAPAIWLAGVISGLVARCPSPIRPTSPGRRCPGCWR